MIQTEAYWVTQGFTKLIPFKTRFSFASIYNHPKHRFSRRPWKTIRSETKIHYMYNNDPKNPFRGKGKINPIVKIEP